MEPVTARAKPRRVLPGHGVITYPVETQVYRSWAALIKERLVTFNMRVVTLLTAGVVKTALECSVGAVVTGVDIW